VIMYADKITNSMERAISETQRRRKLQTLYNEKNGIVPTTVFKSKEAIMEQTKVANAKKTVKNYYVEPEEADIFADPIVSNMKEQDLEKLLKETQKAMEKAAKDLDFIEAARLRDELNSIKKKLGK
jgi:excinuclease ABC subunit B